MMELPDFMRRHVALYEARGEPYTVRDGKMYRPYGWAVRPYGPIRYDYTLDRPDALGVLRELRGRMLVCTDGFHPEAPESWYGVICERFTPLDALSAKRRSEIRRGLAQCDVRRLDAAYLARHGYSVFRKAYGRYRGNARPDWDEAGFRTYLEQSQPYDDIVHVWGALHGSRLVAFALVNVFDCIEATYWMIKTDPDYLSLYPVYALIYTMNEHYLTRAGCQYVNDGWRAVVHQTGVQDFLIRKFGFRKAHSRLMVTYGPWLAIGVCCLYPFRRLVARVTPSAGSLLALEQFRRAGCGPTGSPVA